MGRLETTMSISNPVWHVPFTERKTSGAHHQNFLVQYDNVYIMDNHRAAYWCWLRECDLLKPFNLIHIDRHNDTLQSNLEAWHQVLPPVGTLSIQDYLDLKFHGSAPAGSYPLVRWDNYLSLFLRRESANLSRFVNATHGEGDLPNVKPSSTPALQELPGAVRCLADIDPAPWICNIDLDYFFYSVDQQVAGRLVTDDYLESIVESVQAHRESGAIQVTTICLSPECCGGWAPAEEIAHQVCALLGVPFTLPSP